MSEEAFDVAIIGAGPAGALASIALAKEGRSVVLIDRKSFPRKSESAGWLNALALPLLGSVGVDVKPLMKHAFSKVTFHSADFDKSAQPRFAEPPGYLINRWKLGDALVDTAKKSGVRLFQEAEVEDLRLSESSVRIKLARGEAVEGRLLLLASGRASDLLGRVGVMPSRDTAQVWTAQVEAPLSRKAVGSEPSVAVILGMDRLGSFAFSSISPDRVAISVFWFGKREEVLPNLSRICADAYSEGIVPVDLSPNVASATTGPSPASQALDMDSHVGKHTLVVGDAGGFVSALSNEGIYPAMWSAQIAAAVLHESLEMKHSQDGLITFNSQWRMAMADFLRTPHTDIQFLLPLIFSNQSMADRMGAAFFSGENI